MSTEMTFAALSKAGVPLLAYVHHRSSQLLPSSAFIIFMMISK
jgi:hypothetical protein